MASVIPAARSFAAPLIPGHYEAGSWSNSSVNHAMRVLVVIWAWAWSGVLIRTDTSMVRRVPGALKPGPIDRSRVSELDCTAHGAQVRGSHAARCRTAGNTPSARIYGTARVCCETLGRASASAPSRSIMPRSNMKQSAASVTVKQAASRTWLRRCGAVIPPASSARRAGNIAAQTLRPGRGGEDQLFGLITPSPHSGRHYNSS